MVKVMNKTDYEVLLQYVEETDKEFYESLSTQKTDYVSLLSIWN